MLCVSGKLCVCVHVCHRSGTCVSGNLCVRVVRDLCCVCMSGNLCVRVVRNLCVCQGSGSSVSVHV